MKLYRLHTWFLFLLWSRYHSSHTHPKSMAAPTKLPRMPTIGRLHLECQKTSTDVVKYCKNDFRRLKKKSFLRLHRRFATPETETLPAFHKKSLEVIRINFVEIPWLGSLLKTRVFTFPDVVSTASRDDLQLTRDWTSLAFDRERPDSRYELSRNTFWYHFME